MIEALILGFVQGLTEFLPISSSAHLRILGEFLPGAQDPGAAFTAITQLGTETAVVVFFWRDIVRIISHWFGSFTGRVPRTRPRRPHGLAHHRRLDPDRRARPALPGRDRDHPALAVDHRDDAHHLRHHPRARRLGRREAAQARPDHRAARHLLRARAVALPDPGRLTLGRHHHHGPAARLRARRRRALRVPARDPGRVRQRAAPAVQELRRAGGLRPHRDGGGHARGVRRGDPRDRVLHELHLEAQLPAVRDLPHRCSAARSSRCSAQARSRPERARSRTGRPARSAAAPSVSRRGCRRRGRRRGPRGRRRGGAGSARTPGRSPRRSPRAHRPRRAPARAG